MTRDDPISAATSDADSARSDARRLAVTCLSVSALIPLGSAEAKSPVRSMPISWSTSSWTTSSSLDTSCRL